MQMDRIGLIEPDFFYAKWDAGQIEVLFVFLLNKQISYIHIVQLCAPFDLWNIYGRKCHYAFAYAISLPGESDTWSGSDSLRRTVYSDIVHWMLFSACCCQYFYGRGSYRIAVGENCERYDAILHHHDHCHLNLFFLPRDHDFPADIVGMRVLPV